MSENDGTTLVQSSATEPEESAVVAASAAGVQLRELTTVEDFLATESLFVTIWGREGNPPLSSELLKALSKAGHYLGGAYADGVLVGATVGFHSSPERRVLHSHIAGVAPAFASRSVGFAMKLHQRAWAVARGIPTIEWTFDPLVSRNAHFNINKLGAMPVEYLDNFYGVMQDALNGFDESDRLLVRWELLDPAAVMAASGHNAPFDGGLGEYSFVPVPDDIEALRATDLKRARQWRVTVREGLTNHLKAGGRIVGFSRAQGYILSNAGEQN